MQLIFSFLRLSYITFYHPNNLSVTFSLQRYKPYSSKESRMWKSLTSILSSSSHSFLQLNPTVWSNRSSRQGRRPPDDDALARVASPALPTSQFCTFKRLHRVQNCERTSNSNARATDIRDGVSGSWGRVRSRSWQGLAVSELPREGPALFLPASGVARAPGFP